MMHPFLSAPGTYPPLSQHNNNNRRQILLGSGLALFSAATFSLNLVLAAISYQYGANIHALNLSRAVAFLVCLIIIVLIQGKGISLTGKAYFWSFVVGILLCAEMYTLLGAIKTIPVALAILIFYTYPIIIALYRWIRRVERFSYVALLFLLLAFCGLLVVLIDAPVSTSMTGVSFAIAAAVVMSMMLLASEHSLANYDNQVVLMYALSVVTAIVVILSLTVVELEWPSQTIGWLAFAGSSAFYVVATFCLFKAVAIIGSLKTAVIDNTAPIWATLFGYLLLQQSLTLQQGIGATVVVSAVIGLQIVNSRSTSPE